jgi:hypothetical protein
VGSSYKSNAKSFLFLVKSPTLKHPIGKCTQKNTSNSVYAYSAYGPVFGGGFDMYICNNYTTNSNYSNLGYTYDPPTTYTGNKQHYLAGSYNFTVVDMEVFGLKK